MTTNITAIPLNKLTVWTGNVRKVQNKGFIDELAASILAHGLQQNLVVKKDGKGFAVVAGAQRLKAMQQLADEGHIEKSHAVPCRVIAACEDATELSLAENAVRDDMHPADQFDAFRALIDKGMPLPDVAARFGVSDRVVAQRLKLARVSARVLKAYRTGKLTLEQVMAFAVSDDHAAQNRVLADVPRRFRTPEMIRDALTEDDVSASDRRVGYVTLKSYETAGGTLRRDLFTDADEGVFILDVPLLDRLALEKLERAAASVRREGWKWVQTCTDFGYDERSGFRHLHPALAPLSPEAVVSLQQLQRECDTLLEAWNDAGDDAERPAALDALEAQIDRLNDRDEVWPAETLAIAGAVVTIGRDGKTSVERGLVRPEDMPRKTKKVQTATTDAHDSPGRSAFAAVLIESLTTQRTAAMAAQLVSSPRVALAAVVHALASQAGIGLKTGSCLLLTARPQDLAMAEGSKALTALEEARTAWRRRLPAEPEAQWAWCLRQDTSILLELLAFCAALTVNGVRAKTDCPDDVRLSHATALASALPLDLRAWFTPTAKNYFGRVSKEQILADLRAARGTAPAPAWEKLTKTELAALAERETAGTGWLPAVLR